MLQFGFLSVLSPNTRLQRTPLRVEQDRAFFSASFCYNVLAIYCSGAAKAQPVSPLLQMPCLTLLQAHSHLRYNYTRFQKQTNVPRMCYRKVICLK